jgi:hypothetical protein
VLGGIQVTRPLRARDLYQGSAPLSSAARTAEPDEAPSGYMAGFTGVKRTREPSAAWSRGDREGSAGGAVSGHPTPLHSPRSLYISDLAYPNPFQTVLNVVRIAAGTSTGSASKMISGSATVSSRSGSRS